MTVERRATTEQDYCDLVQEIKDATEKIVKKHHAHVGFIQHSSFQDIDQDQRHGLPNRHVQLQMRITMFARDVCTKTIVYINDTPFVTEEKELTFTQILAFHTGGKYVNPKDCKIEFNYHNSKAMYALRFDECLPLKKGMKIWVHHIPKRYTVLVNGIEHKVIKEVLSYDDIRALANFRSVDHVHIEYADRASPALMPSYGTVKPGEKLNIGSNKMVIDCYRKTFRFHLNGKEVTTYKDRINYEDIVRLAHGVITDFVEYAVVYSFGDSTRFSCTITLKPDDKDTLAVQENLHVNCVRKS